MNYISNQHQNIKKIKGSGMTFSICLVFILLALFFSSVFFFRTALNYNYRNIDNALTDALLGGAIVDLKEYAVTGNILIPDVKISENDNETYLSQSLNLFTKCLNANLVDKKSYGQNIKNVRVVKYVIFNVSGNTISAYIFDNPQSNHASYHKASDNELNNLFDNDPVKHKITTSDGVIAITKTSVYAKLDFELKTAPNFLWNMSIDKNNAWQTLSLSRCIAITN